MKNLIRGHIYQLRRDYFFYGCLAVSIVYLFMSIRLTLSLASALSPLMGGRWAAGYILGWLSLIHI